MNNSSDTSFLSRLLARTGGWYPILALIAGQLITGPFGLLLAAMPVRINAELSSIQVMRLVSIAGLALLVRDIILLTGMYLNNRNMFDQLGRLHKGEALVLDESEEELVWRMATSYPWKYIVVALLSLFLFVLAPSLVYMRLVMNTNTDQMLYVALAASAAGLVLSIAEVYIIEGLMRPAREALFPKQNRPQLSGLTGAKILIRIMLAILILVVVGNLLVAPASYHQTVSVINHPVDAQILPAFRVQLATASMGSLVFGFLIALLVTFSLTSPIRKMIQAFKKVEEGDLSQHLPVSASDEIGELTVYFNRMVSRLKELNTTLESQVTSRTEQLRATLDVSRATSAIQNMDELINRVVNLIVDRFGYYYAAIFMIDATGTSADLKDATGMAGQALKERKHKLDLHGKSMVGTAINSRQASVAQDVGLEPVRFDNPLLPDTRSELALPLIVGERVIGALNVQSTKEAAFSEEDIDTLRGMANQVAVALENARLFEETQKNLEELRVTQRMYVSETWGETAKSNTGYEYITERDASQSQDKGPAIDVPLTLREQVIGQISLEGNEEWSPEERTLIEAVATQAVLAMENARLLEESQQMALRERLAAEITGKIWASPNTDFILQTAIRELGRALRVDEATIELKPD